MLKNISKDLELTFSMHQPILSTHSQCVCVCVCVCVRVCILIYLFTDFSVFYLYTY